MNERVSSTVYALLEPRTNERKITYLAPWPPSESVETECLRVASYYVPMTKVLAYRDSSTLSINLLQCVSQCEVKLECLLTAPRSLVHFFLVDSITSFLL